MKTAVSIVLTLVLISLPSRQALAQTSAEASSTADVSLGLEEGALESPEALAPIPTAMLLWQPIAGNRADLVEELSFRPAPVPGWNDWSTEKKAWVVGGMVVGLMVLGIVSIG